MREINAVLKGVSKILYWISGISLVFLMLLTVTDVVLRVFYEPIAGVYDLTLILAGIIVSFAVPYATRRRVHTKMEFLDNLVPPGMMKFFSVITRCLGTLFFLLVGWNLITYGMRLYATGETSHTIHIPLFPFVLSMGAVCLFNCLIILEHLFMVLSEREEEV